MLPKLLRLRQKHFSGSFVMQTIWTHILKNSKSSHHSNRQQVSNTISRTQNDFTVILKRMWFCPELLFYYNSLSRKNEHHCIFFITFEEKYNWVNHPSSQRTHSYTTNRSQYWIHRTSIRGSGLFSNWWRQTAIWRTLMETQTRKTKNCTDGTSSHN